MRRSKKTAEQWIESSGDKGFEFIGFADELYDGRMIDHQGWFIDEDLDSVMRGAVYRKGLALYPGYRVGRTGCSRADRGSTWHDQHDDKDTGAGLVYTDEPQAWQKTGRRAAEFEDSDAYRDALRGTTIIADRRAERAAEKEREYQELWRMGSNAAQSREEAKRLRGKARELITALRAERRNVRKGLSVEPDSGLCRVIRDRIEDYLQQANAERQAYAEALQARNGGAYWTNDSKLVAAFDDGLSCY